MEKEKENGYEGDFGPHNDAEKWEGNREAEVWNELAAQFKELHVNVGNALCTLLTELPDKTEDELEGIYDNLMKLKSNLDVLMVATGAQQRMERCKAEIKEKGWNYIIGRYYPDVNRDDPAAEPLFEFYRVVYENMQRNKEID